MKEELKPCPFCGSGGAVVYQDRGFYRGSCMACDAEGPPYSREDEALIAWNTRTSPNLIGLPVIDPSMLEGK